jgi:hypothetical protein
MVENYEGVCYEICAVVLNIRALLSHVPKKFLLMSNLSQISPWI